MLRNWAMAEFANVDRWTTLKSVVPVRILAKVQKSDVGSFNDSEWLAIEQIIAALRSPLLKGLLPLRLRWFDGSIDMTGLSQAKIINWPPFVNLARS